MKYFWNPRRESREINLGAPFWELARPCLFQCNWDPWDSVRCDPHFNRTFRTVRNPCLQDPISFSEIRTTLLRTVTLPYRNTAFRTLLLWRGPYLGLGSCKEANVGHFLKDTLLPWAWESGRVLKAIDRWQFQNFQLHFHWCRVTHWARKHRMESALFCKWFFLAWVLQAVN